MKRIALLAAALTAVAPAAFAYNSAQLTAAEAAQVRQYLPSADLSNLTPAQAGAIKNALTSGDTNIGASVYSILN